MPDAIQVCQDQHPAANLVSIETDAEQHFLGEILSQELDDDGRKCSEISILVLVCLEFWESLFFVHHELSGATDYLSHHSTWLVMDSIRSLVRNFYDCC